MSKSTNSKLRIHGLKQVDRDEFAPSETFYLCHLYFELHEEDYRLLKECLNWLNANRATIYKDEDFPLQDEGDFLLNGITYTIHRWKEIKDQKPFTLRMDRKPPKA